MRQTEKGKINYWNEFIQWSRLKYICHFSLYCIRFNKGKRERGQIPFFRVNTVGQPSLCVPVLPPFPPFSLFLVLHCHLCLPLIHLFILSYITFNYEYSPMFFGSFLLVFQLGLWKPQRLHAPLPLLWFPAGCCFGWLLTSLLSAVTSTCSWPPQSQKKSPSLSFCGCL